MEVPNTAVSPDPGTPNVFFATYPDLLLFAHHVVMDTLTGDRGQMTVILFLASLLRLKPVLPFVAPEVAAVTRSLPARGTGDNTGGFAV